MTKVQRKYKLTKPLNDELLGKISDAHGIYGFQRLQIDPSLDAITVEYDASRLSLESMENALSRAGIPIATA